MRCGYWTIIVLALGLLATCSFGCDDDKPQSNLPTIKMDIGSQKYTLEVADNDLSREIGLMRRDSMPADHGMIFVFPDEQQREFWMKNTRIPLDILYLDARGKVVSIKQMQAYDQHTTPSVLPAKYAIELNAGQAAACGVKVGDKLNIPPEAANPRPADARSAPTTQQVSRTPATASTSPTSQP